MKDTNKFFDFRWEKMLISEVIKSFKESYKKYKQHPELVTEKLKNLIDGKNEGMEEVKSRYERRK